MTKKGFSTSWESDGSVVEIPGSPLCPGGSNNDDAEDCLLLEMNDDCMASTPRKDDEPVVGILNSRMCPGGSNKYDAYSNHENIKAELIDDESNTSPQCSVFKRELNEDKADSSLLKEADFKADYASDENAIYVSAEIYDREKANFDALVQETLSAEKQRAKLKSQGKDKELLQAEKEVLKLNERLELLSQYMDNLRTEAPEHTDNRQLETDEKPSWSHLYAGVNRYRNKADGSVAEFYVHKSNIISGLKVSTDE